MKIPGFSLLWIFLIVYIVQCLDLAELAKNTLPRSDYETIARDNVHVMRKSRQKTQREGILCYVQLVWDDHHRALLESNSLAARDFCSSWHFLILPSPDMKQERPIETNRISATIKEILKKIQMGRRFTISGPPYPKESSIPIYIELCNKYVNYFLRKPTFAVHPCQLITAGNLEKTNPVVYSKASLVATLITRIVEYEYVWLVDGDISFNHFNFTEFKHMLHHTLGHAPPLVLHPLISPDIRSPQYLNRGGWNIDGSILAAEVGMIGKDAPLVYGMYLEWFILTILMPLIPSYQMYGSGEGFAEKLSQGALIFLEESKKYHIDMHGNLHRRVPCVVVIGNMYLEHTVAIKKEQESAAFAEVVDRAFPFNDAKNYKKCANCLDNSAPIIRAYQHHTWAEDD
jgi:hypothetical protein